MKKLLTVLLAMLMLVGLTACSPAVKPGEKSDVKVGFIYIGDPADGGFTKMHDEGRKYMIEQLGVKTAEVFNVPDSETQTFDTKARELIDQDFNVIVACSFGYGKPAVSLAKEFPNVKFLHFSGSFLEENLGNFFGKMFEVRYISGAVAGLNIPAGGTVGYVAAYPIPEVIRAINAFTLGLRTTNPTATVKVAWTNTWFDPTVEKQAGEGLVKQGVDAVAIHQDTPSALEAAKAAGKWAIGYHTDMSESLGDSCLISAIWNLGPYYTSQVKAIIEGTWKSAAVWGGLEDGENGMVAITKVSTKAAKGSQELADELVKKITAGELKIFAGPIKDNTGKLMVKEGEVYPDASIWEMTWFVEGVTVTN